MRKTTTGTQKRPGGRTTEREVDGEGSIQATGCVVRPISESGKSVLGGSAIIQRSATGDFRDNITPAAKIDMDHSHVSDNVAMRILMMAFGLVVL
ncbi:MULTISPECIES: hypothetical protein [Cupriavidus]